MLTSTQEESQGFSAQLFPFFQEYVRLHSSEISTIERVNSLDGITSLPVHMSLGGVEKTVLIPISLFVGNINSYMQAAEDATTRANAAADRADVAATKVTNAITDIATEKQKALQAASDADAAATACKTATSAANTAASKATTAASEADTATAACKAATAEAITATNDAKKATSAANDAAVKAEGAAKKATDAITNIEAEKKAAMDAAASANSAAASAREQKEASEAAEKTRQDNEAARVAAETARKVAEAERVEEFARLKIESQAATSFATNAGTSASTQAEKAALAASTANAEAQNLGKLKNDCLDATGAAQAAAQNAGEKMVEIGALVKTISGESSAAPVKMEVSVLDAISTSNKQRQRISVMLYPTYVMRNVIFQKVSGASVAVDPSGGIDVLGEGESVFYVIPTQNTELWQRVSINVRGPHIRRTSTGKMRIANGKIRIV